MSDKTTSTTTDPSVAPTAALSAAADPSPTSPAEEGRQWYTIRHYRLDAIGIDPILLGEVKSPYLDALYISDEGFRVIVRPNNEPDVFEVYTCRTPMHAICIIAAINAMEDDARQEPVEELVDRIMTHIKDQSPTEESAA